MKTTSDKLADFVFEFFENEKYSRIACLTVSGLLVLGITIIELIRAVL